MPGAGDCEYWPQVSLHLGCGRSGSKMWPLREHCRQSPHVLCRFLPFPLLPAQYPEECGTPGKQCCRNTYHS